MTHAPRLLTLPEIADELGVAFHVVRYAVQRARIEPIQRVGITRVFSESQIPEIRAALEVTQRPEPEATAAHA